MDKPVDYGSHEFRDAVLLYTGFMTKPWPQSCVSEMKEKYGNKRAEEFISSIKCLYSEYYSLGKLSFRASVGEQIAFISGEFGKIYPDISGRVVAAFEWCYAYDNK